MDILSTLTALQTVEAGLTISSPIAATIKKVFTLPPNRNVALPDTPCWLNGWELTTAEWTMDTSPPMQCYTVTAQLFVNDADTNRAANIASAFHVALVAALARDTTLGGAVSGLTLTGKLALLDWDGQSYPGLEERIVVELLN